MQRRFIAVLILGVIGVLVFRSTEFFHVESKDPQATTMDVLGFLICEWIGFFLVGISIGFIIYHTFPFSYTVSYSLLFLGVLCIPILKAAALPFWSWSFVLLPIVDYVLWKQGHWKLALLLTCMELAFTQVIIFGDIRSWMHPEYSGYA